MTKRSRKEFEDDYPYGDGNQWCRGPMIGKSGSGQIFLAALKKCRGLRRIVADRLRPIMAVKSTGVCNSFSLRKEGMVLDDLQDCPYIRRIFGEETTVSKDGEMTFNLLLEYPSGGTLKELIERSGGDGLPKNEVWHYTKCLLLGLVQLHGHGYIHRNLNPENIILLRCNSNKFIAKIGDYESVTTAERLQKTLWRSYSRMNFEYLSPEAFVDGNQGFASDIWAVGCIVYEMLTGESIWEGKMDWEIKDELWKMKKGSGGIKFGDGILLSKKAREFLNACFEREAESRWNAERLLRLPFLGNVSDDEESETRMYSWETRTLVK